MSQANTMKPKRMHPTVPKRWRDSKGRLVESRSIIKPKPSKFNGMDMPDILQEVRLNKRKKEQAKRGGGTIRAKAVQLAAQMFGLGLGR